MPARLSPEEREARRKERSRRSFSDAAYQHYDPKTEGYGSADEWIAAAEALASGRGTLHFGNRGQSSSKINPDLVTLNLTEMPADIAGLKRAFRNTLFIVHPDHGGTDAACIAAMKAFERLTKFY
jgi:hypothetical protein